MTHHAVLPIFAQQSPVREVRIGVVLLLFSERRADRSISQG